jgi:archaemetzincin
MSRGGALEEERYIYLFFAEGIRDVDFEKVRSQIQREFTLSTIAQQMKLDLRPYYDKGRKQFYSTLILKEFLKKLPKDAEKALLIVDVDLFIPILTFVFGEAQLGGKVGIVSITRLRQEFYGLPSNAEILQRRLIKEIKHELGHTFGLLHCSFRECVMSFASNILAVDQKGTSFCASCRDFLFKNLIR